MTLFWENQVREDECIRTIVQNSTLISTVLAQAVLHGVLYPEVDINGI